VLSVAMRPRFISSTTTVSKFAKSARASVETSV
jgi:hypothetical protein